ncbi:MAG TPA: Holliday junction branch migration protein RuvA [Pseudomonadales bacterium]|jgi:Holliday junction DNA helicase RuvA|nr:Holliday junction branch migration protein RuvA [Gammaproteobacteria bacterium]MDP6026793.1 Holliday junction branch migration protein RuvA [Pseudomonadales bacterium]MDP6317505.1 Holliday junction branch migration protein RuvA [Pseudomonadales bacterium]MDP7315011.1 Holliday junction branch migration protein RuvA [Pseudomonadales bacterium]HJL61160.1 Holliday junction branch migration protein RuvA [Pseudomonadales bacterium]|tara:strand:+ start:3937 stop:4518 length:582 start_codon:yes stop_codon:yes gene_type:complete
MIGRIRGQLIEKAPGQVLVDVSGVGYEIDVPLTTYYELGELNDSIILHTQMIVREDNQLLYGFISISEREMFRSLIKVNGVGPKLAITILSGMDAKAFGHSVRNNDVQSLVALPGVGKKTAERLIIEMRDRLPEFGSEESDMTGKSHDSLADAETALVGLGFKPQDAARALSQLEDKDASVENLLKQALKALT